MAEENRFQAEMTLKLDLVIQKLGGYEERFNELNGQFRELNKKVDNNSRDLRLLKKEVRISSGRLSDSLARVIEMLNRIAEIKKEIQLLNEQGLRFEAELKIITTDLHFLADKAEELPENIEALNEIDLRLEKLEEKVFA